MSTQNQPSTNLVARLSESALTRMHAENLSFLADFIPKIEGSGNGTTLRGEAELARDLALHHFNLIARETLTVASGPEEYEHALWNEIPRFTMFTIEHYPWLKNDIDGEAPMLGEISTGMTFFCLRLNPRPHIPAADGHHWNVGALTGEALARAALKWEAEAWRIAAAQNHPAPPPVSTTAISVFTSADERDAAIAGYLTNRGGTRKYLAVKAGVSYSDLNKWKLRGNSAFSKTETISEKTKRIEAELAKSKATNLA